MTDTGLADKQQASGTAKRIRKNQESPANVTVMTTVTCESCGARFAISHRPPLLDAALATRQAAWLADQLVWDHIQEHKHPGSVSLPTSDQMK